MVICLERGADLHMAQLMSLPLTVSCFSKIQIDFTFLVLAHPGSPGKRATKHVCVCVCGQLICSPAYIKSVNSFACIWPAWAAYEVTTLWRYTDLFIISTCSACNIPSFTKCHANPVL